MATTLMVNDEYFGERCVGTRDEFRATLMRNFREWHADYEGEMSFDEYVENALDEHLTEADADEIENCERLNAPVPSKIKDARKSAGLTQEQAARLIGATRRAWQEWEAGRRNMPGAKWELFRLKTKRESMKTYYISTDAASMEIEARTLADAIEEFGECPKWVKTAEDFERWLDKVGGFGFITENDVSGPGAEVIE